MRVARFADSLLTLGACACVALTGCAANSGEAAAPDVSGYTKKEGSSVAKPIITNAEFNLGSEGWRLPEGYRIDPTGGRNGTRALAYQRTDPAKYLQADQPIALVPGARYTFGVWVRTEGVTGEDTGGTICLEFTKGGKWLAGIYLAGVKGQQDWTYLEGSGAVPQDADPAARLTLYFRPKMTGEVWFDDVTIEPEAPNWSAYLIGAPIETVPANDGKITIGSVYRSPDEEIPESTMACRVQALAGDRALGEFVRPIRNGRIAADLGKLPEGTVSLRLTLLDTTNKWILGEQSLSFAAVPPDRPIPANACMIDSRGRAIVGGKPFLPVGLYFSHVAHEDLDRIAKSPFNCIMPYGSLNLKFPGTRETGEKAVREVLDACHAKGIKVIFSIKDVYKGSQWETKECQGATEEAEIVAKAVNAFKDHPALLAWYINDELPLSLLSRLAARRREVNRLDPFHPTWSVLYQFDDLPGYGTTCDIPGVDPYPIFGGRRSAASVISSLRSRRSCSRTSRGRRSTFTSKREAFSRRHSRTTGAACGCSSRPSAPATLAVGTRAPLTSKYGRCRATADGKYVFEGKDVCSDVLEDE